MVFRKFRTAGYGFWVFVCLVLVMMMSMAPSVSLANGPGMGMGGRAMMPRPSNPHRPQHHYPGHRPAPRPDLIEGTIQDLGESEITIEVLLPGHSHHADQAAREIVLQVGADTVVFSQDLEVIPFDELAIDSMVTAAARSVWGSPVATLFYAGTMHDLSERSYRGRLVEDLGNQLLLATPWEKELTVLVDEDATIWVDGDSMERPDELQVGLPLQILGTLQEGGTVLAALITSGPMR